MVGQISMRRAALRGALAVVSVLGLVGAPAGSASAQTPDNRVIAAGVSAGGVDLSGLTVTAASKQLLDALVPQLNRRVLVDIGRHSFHLAPGAMKVGLDGPRTAERAYLAGQKAQGAPVSVPLETTYDQARLSHWVSAVAGHVDVPARNSWVTIGLTKLYLHHSKTGLALDQKTLARELSQVIVSPTAPHELRVKLAVSHPALTAQKVMQQYATVVTVDRAHFRLRLFKMLHEVVSYPIAVGRAGLETPTGIYHVREREVNPSWHVPNSPWAGSLAGQTIPPGPNDPIVARWLGLGGGVGIHGTNEPFSIGSAASHGCIRMLVRDVIALYPRVPLGTTVYIR